jgi:hypothetical protein
MEQLRAVQGMIHIVAGLLEEIYFFEMALMPEKVNWHWQGKIFMRVIIDGYSFLGRYDQALYRKNQNSAWATFGLLLVHTQLRKIELYLYQSCFAFREVSSEVIHANAVETRCQPRFRLLSYRIEDVMDTTL